MGEVAKTVKAMSTEDILAFEKAGEVTIAIHSLRLSDIKIVRGFKRPGNRTEEEIEAAGDGDVLVVLDLVIGESQHRTGAAREIVNRVQKLKKKSALEPTDPVQVYFKTLDEDKSVSQQVLETQKEYITESVGSPLCRADSIPAGVAILGEESFEGVSDLKLSFTITLARL